MPKQYDRALIEVDVKKRLEETRDKLRLPSLSATIIYLIDHLESKDELSRAAISLH